LLPKKGNEDEKDADNLKPAKVWGWSKLNSSKQFLMNPLIGRLFEKRCKKHGHLKEK